MNKKELIDRVSQVTSMSKDDVTTAVEATFDSIVTTLKEGGSVRIVGFGNFEVSQRKASTRP